MQYHARPFKLQQFKIEVTYHCDLNCVHCSSDGRPSNTLQIRREDCLRILSEAAEMGVKEVAFSGGEPLAWPYLSDAVEAAVKNRLKTTVYTSGNTDGFGDKAGQLHKLGASRFIFSVFGSTPATHERITRTAGSFERTKAAMRAARSLGLTTEFHFVPMSCNYRELEQVAHLAQQLGAAVVSVLRLVPQGRAALLRGWRLSRTQNMELRRQIQALKTSGFNIRTGSPYNFLMLNPEGRCWAAIDRLIVAPDLRLYPCDAFKRISATELVETEEYSSLACSRLAECWAKSPYFEAVRKYLTTPFPVPCDTCGCLERCASGCLAQKAIAYGGLAKRPDPDCLGRNFHGDTA